MIALEKLFDNSVSQRNFDKLALAVLDMGSDPATGGPRSVSVRFGTQTLTWAGGTQASNFPSISHGLGRTPVVVLVSPIGGLSAGTAWAVASAFGYGASTFVLQAKTHDESSPAAATTALIGWVAIG